MQKLGIWAIAIAGAFLIGVLSANPVVEAVGGWQGALGLHEGDSSAHHEIPEAQVYELSDTITILAGDFTGGTITLECLDGDWLDSSGANFVTDPIIFVDAITVVHDTNVAFMLDPVSVASTGVSLTKRIGYSVVPELIGSGTPLGIDVDVTVSVLCYSPS